MFREWLRPVRREVPVANVCDRPDPVVSAYEAVDVAQALAGLDPDHSEVLVLRFVLDLSSKAVAAALGISDDAVRQRVTRAKSEFKKVWDR